MYAHGAAFVRCPPDIIICISSFTGTDVGYARPYGNVAAGAWAAAAYARTISAALSTVIMGAFVNTANLPAADHDVAAGAPLAAANAGS